MNPDPDDFETLRKLMALKRHEQPPPEYLDHLSGRIITGSNMAKGSRRFWERISASFSLRPTMAYAFGLTICGALGLSGVYLVWQEMELSEASGVAVVRIPPSTAAALASLQRQQEQPVLHVANWLGATNPAAETQPLMPLFSASHAPATVTVSYELAR